MEKDLKRHHKLMWKIFKGFFGVSDDTYLFQIQHIGMQVQ